MHMVLHMRMLVLIPWYARCGDARDADARHRQMDLDPEFLKHYEASTVIPVYCQWIPKEKGSVDQTLAWPKDTRPGPTPYTFQAFVAKIEHNMHKNTMMHMGRERMRRDSWWTWQEDNVRQYCDETFCTPSTMVAGFGQVMTGSTLHLCYTIYHRKMCETQDKESRKGGSLSLRCFLHMAYRDQLGFTNQTQFGLLRHMRDMRADVKQKYKTKHTGCKPNEHYPDGFCDVGEPMERHALKVLGDRITKWNTEECLEPRESPPLTSFHAFGPPEASPPWMQLDCEKGQEENEMWVKLGARRQRVMYLQLWFMKFERDLYQGDDQWFFDALEATDKKMYGHAMDLKNHRSMNLNSDTLPSVKPDYPHEFPPKEGASAARLLPSDLWQPLAVWNFIGIPKASSIQFADAISPEPTWEIPLPLMAHGIPQMKKFAPDRVPYPEYIGSTRFRKYLSAPEEWNRELWMQIAPIHFDRYQAQELETKTKVGQKKCSTVLAGERFQNRISK
eukprot:GEMP01022361.1.p1 GENE.GEMP01022361.1~~GEMP01022361.1.p1  ORF type:complete len:503 (+),score=89.41 GEMP01022361.1:291-1799(+)